MKKNHDLEGILRFSLKLDLKMKLTIFLFTISLFTIQAGTYSQNTKLSIDLQDVSVLRILNEIEKNSEFKFLVNTMEIDITRKTTISVKKKRIADILDIVFWGQEVDYDVNGKQIIIKLIDTRIGSDLSENDLEQGQKIITGNVTDVGKTPLPGVNISIIGSTKGTETDFDGNYTIKVKEGDVLEFSYVGMEPQKIKITKQTVVNVILKDDSSSLDEVVIVGFGTQKKESVVSSISSISPSDLKVPSSNLTTALAGRVAGLISYQRSGEPGMDNAEFFIRGVSTFGFKVNPLILIDNVEVTTTDLARLVPDDVASFSILKDATATAIYGARGANGVILITTKQGVAGPAKINFRYVTSVASPVSTVKLADPITYMRLNNEALLTRNPGAAVSYPQSQIDNTVAGNDSVLYPTVDWASQLLKDFTVNQKINLSVSGGGEIARYLVSGSMSQDNGILNVPGESSFNNNIDLKTYSLRSNININLNNKTELMVRLNGSFDDYIGPITGGQQVFRDLVRTSPSLFLPFYPKGNTEKFVNHILFGNADEGNYLNPYADLVKGYREYSRAMMLAQLELRVNLSDITEGLRFRGLLNTTRNSFFDLRRQYNPFFYKLLGTDSFTDAYQYEVLNESTGTEFLDYNEGGKRVSTVFYLEGALNYDRTFADKHSVSGLLVYIMRNRLSGNAGSLQLSLPFRNIGVSGRFTYGYDSRYFAEINFGYNGSERFHEKNRYGFFPSIGGGWSVSNESFWEPMKPYISKFKIRGSYGVIGNDAIGQDKDRFQYISEVNMSDSRRAAFFGTDLGSGGGNGISVQRYANPLISWEEAYKSNLGIEMELFNKLNVVADIFKENRKNIFMRRDDIPTTVGLAADVFANIGEATSQGLDVQLTYNQSFSSEFSMQIMGNFTYATSEFKKIEEPDFEEKWLSKVGHSLRQQWGYIAERLFIDDEEVANSPQQIFGNERVRGGDIKYKDVNGDGQITTLDRVPIGLPTVPEIVYGFGFSSRYKNFDFSAFFQGSARSSFWIDSEATSPFAGYRYRNDEHPGKILQNQVLQVYADNHWSEANRNIYALWPRLSTSQVENNNQRSTWFMRNGDFLRLKQLEVGFTLPKELMKKLKMNSLRVYFTGSNLFTLSKFKLWDVEMAGNGLGYPIQRVISFGINASL